MLVSAPGAGAGRGAVYVVFGSRSPGDVRLDELGERGLAIDGSFEADPDDGTCDSGCDRSGGSALADDAAPAGDVNGDGLDDIVVAAVGAGRAAVVYGRREPGRIGFLPAGAGMPIENLSWPAGVPIDYMPVAGAGDVNGDGLDDVLVGADPTWGGHCGRCRGNAYLIFGKESPSAVRVDRLRQGGIRITGGERRQGVGYDVAGPGDVNGDRRPDLLIGTSSSAAVILAGAKPGVIDIDRLGRRGFLVTQTGVAGVDRIGDWNRDGLADFAVGHTVVFGRRARRRVSLEHLARGFAVTNQGFCIGREGEVCPPAFPTQTERLTGAGDMNGDGRDDIVLGDAATGPRMRGAAFVILAAGLPLVVIDQEADEVPVSAAGQIELRLLCPANTVRRCGGTLRLTARRGSARTTLLRVGFRKRAGFHFRAVAPDPILGTDPSAPWEEPLRGGDHQGQGRSRTAGNHGTNPSTASPLTAVRTLRASRRPTSAMGSVRFLRRPRAPGPSRRRAGCGACGCPARAVRPRRSGRRLRCRSRTSRSPSGTGPSPRP